MARNEWKEAQELSIKCTTLFTDAASLKSFRDLLVNEIVPQIKSMSATQELENQLIQKEREVMALIERQQSIPPSLVDTYIQTASVFWDKQMPQTTAVLMFNKLALNPQYDETVTIPLLDMVGKHRPLRSVLTVDVFTPNFFDQLISDPASSEEIIDKDKFQRCQFICAFLRNLVCVTQPKFVEQLLKHFLIQDYLDKASCDIIGALQKMISNCYSFSLNGEDDLESATIETSNLTNPVYRDLITLLLRSMATAVEDAELNSSQQQMFPFQSDRHLRIEAVILQLVMLYNQDRGADKNQELDWLFEQVRDLKRDSPRLQPLAVSILMKVYFDFGFQFASQNTEVVNALRGAALATSEQAETKTSILGNYVFWSICSTLAQSRSGRQLISEKFGIFSPEQMGAIRSDVETMTPLEIEIALA